MDRDFILDSIRRLSIDGAAPGRIRLESEAGIKAYHWKKFWARYSNAVQEAGLSPNLPSTPYTTDQLLQHFVDTAREIGRIPTEGDLIVRATRDRAFPSAKVFSRLGRKAEIVAKAADYCERHGFADVREMCLRVAPKKARAADATATSQDGFVYLIKSGKHYKIGFSVHAGARERQIGLQMPEAVNTVHVITTDDPPGIEAYWHKRFAAKRKNGEWFELTREDIAAFKRRKFM
jgi:hypothetical protein